MSNPTTERDDVIEHAPNPRAMLKSGRSITGISAILLPFDKEGTIAWADFKAHVARTAAAGLTPAVNMDTGYVNRLDDEARRAVLEHTQDVMSGRSFVAGAFVADEPGDAFDLDAYRQAVDQVLEYGGTPIIFQSHGLTNQSSEEILAAYDAIGRRCDAFIAFELGGMFADFGKIYDLETYAGLLDIPACIGAKHSSLSRTLEWQRLQLRDTRRSDFKVFTGNDLAIDMVKYGSDYLLGLSTFAPDLFAKRDELWAADDPAFYELNDLLQYLGFFAFRDPVPAYKHSAAQFLKLRGWVTSSTPPSGALRRPDSDVPILRNIAERLAAWLD